MRGCFWHRHKGCIDSHIPKSRISYWQPKLTRNVQRDRKNERQLRAAGWDVLVVWECDVKDTLGLLKVLKRFLSRKTPTQK